MYFAPHRYLMAAALLLLTAIALAQQPIRNLKLVAETPPSAPLQTFYVRIVMVEHDVDISGYDLRIGYNSARAELLDIENNTGAGGTGSAAQFNMGGVKSYNEVPYADVYRHLILSTISDVQAPMDPSEDFNLGRLKFQTTATFSGGSSAFPVHLSAHNSGGVFSNLSSIPMNYISLLPPAAVADWAVY